MKVTINQLAASVEVKNTAVEFKVADTKGKHFGDFYVDKVRIEWRGEDAPREWSPVDMG